MTGHAPPFTVWRKLPGDILGGAVMVYGALLGMGWDVARPHVLAVGRRVLPGLVPELWREAHMVAQSRPWTDGTD